MRERVFGFREKSTLGLRREFFSFSFSFERGGILECSRREGESGVGDVSRRG